MTKDLTEEQKKFLEKITTHRKEKVEGLAYSALSLALKANLPVFDLPYYVLQRSREVIENAFKATKFKNAKLIKLRMEFAKECLAEIRSNVCSAPIKEVKDETDERDNRCEPVVQELVKLLLTDDLIFSDEDYFKVILEDEEKVPLSAAISGYEAALDEKMTLIISEHWRRAMDEFWGVSKENVTFEQLNTVLTKNIDTTK